MTNKIVKERIPCDNNINYTFGINKKSNNSIKNLKNQINQKINLLNPNNCDNFHQDINQGPFPLYTLISMKKIYKSKSKLPDVTKEQKTKDSTMEEFRKNVRVNNEENIIFMNENSHCNYNVSEGIGNNYTHTSNNPFNSFFSDNNSSKNDTFKYNHLFRKGQKKKYLTKEILNSTLNNSKNKSSVTSDDAKFKENSESKYPDIIHPQQISNDLISKLREWLISCDLLCYYNLLIKNNIYDIESYISNLKNNKINISFKDIEDLGIKKPGHIFRFLLKVQMDIGVLDNKICNYILGKYNENLLSTIGVNVSINEIRYCGMLLCPSSNDITRNSNYSDIFSFLRSKELIQFKDEIFKSIRLLENRITTDMNDKYTQSNLIYDSINNTIEYTDDGVEHYDSLLFYKVNEFSLEAYEQLDEGVKEEQKVNLNRANIPKKIYGIYRNGEKEELDY